MKSKLFRNITPGASEYAIIAIPKGFLMIPVLMRTEKKLLLSYKDLIQDIFLTDEESFFKKVNDSIIKETFPTQEIILRWSSDVDKALADMSDIMQRNSLLQHQFDSE